MNIKSLTFIKVILVLAGFIFLIGFFLDHSLAALNLPGLLFVIVGTFSAAILGSTVSDFIRFVKVSVKVLFGYRVNIKEDVNEIVYISKLWHEKKIRSVEDELNSIANPFLRYAIELVIDKTPLNEIQSLLRWRAHRIKTNEQVKVQLAQSLAFYAPAFGMLGTIIGLINMLASISAKDIELIGSSMSIALITTFYGILISNLIFKPIAERLERRIHHRLKLISLVMEGVELIYHDRSPGVVYVTLHSFIVDHDDDLRAGKYSDDHSTSLERYKKLLDP